MSWDSQERLDRMRRVEVSDDRVERLMDSVMARIERMPARRPGLVERMSDWLLAMGPLTLLSPRMVMPMGAALLLGLVVGHHLQTVDAGPQLADLLTYNATSVSDF